MPGGYTTGSGVSCSGSSTFTCTVSTSGTGGIIGYVDLPLACGSSVTATVTSAAADPDPSNNSRSRSLC